MDDKNENKIARHSRNPIPGAEFVAASMFAGAITFGMPPGIEAIHADASSNTINLACEEPVNFIEDIVLPENAKSTPDGCAPGIFELERGLIRLGSRDETVVEHIATLIKSVSIPKSWENSTFQPPSVQCNQYTQLLLERLHTASGIIPVKLAAMKEGGLLASFKSTCGNTLRIEIDEDLDAVAVITDGERILYSAVFEGDDLEEAAINVFKNNEMVATFVS